MPQQAAFPCLKPGFTGPHSRRHTTVSRLIDTRKESSRGRAGLLSDWCCGPAARPPGGLSVPSAVRHCPGLEFLGRTRMDFSDGIGTEIAASLAALHTSEPNETGPGEGERSGSRASIRRVEAPPRDPQAVAKSRHSFTAGDLAAHPQPGSGGPLLRRRRGSAAARVLVILSSDRWRRGWEADILDVLIPQKRGSKFRHDPRQKHTNSPTARRNAWPGHCAKPRSKRRRWGKSAPCSGGWPCRIGPSASPGFGPIYRTSASAALAARIQWLAAVMTYSCVNQRKPKSSMHSG